jgi:hypothetical protein
VQNIDQLPIESFDLGNHIEPVAVLYVLHLLRAEPEPTARRISPPGTKAGRPVGPPRPAVEEPSLGYWRGNRSAFRNQTQELPII